MVTSRMSTMERSASTRRWRSSSRRDSSVGDTISTIPPSTSSSNNAPMEGSRASDVRLRRRSRGENPSRLLAVWLASSMTPLRCNTIQPSGMVSRVRCSQRNSSTRRRARPRAPVRENVRRSAMDCQEDDRCLGRLNGARDQRWKARNSTAPNAIQAASAAATPQATLPVSNPATTPPARHEAGRTRSRALIVTFGSRRGDPCGRPPGPCGRLWV